jgi:hypothetical protein
LENRICGYRHRGNAYAGNSAEYRQRDPKLETKESDLNRKNG